jgi:hypothetical protein
MKADQKQRSDFAALYQKAFDRYGAAALWNKRRLSSPEAADALVVARALRVEGDLDARRLAEEIEAACLASH